MSLSSQSSSQSLSGSSSSSSSSSSGLIQPLTNPYNNQAKVTSLSCYECLDQVGEGTYGYVYRAKDKRSGELVALKRLIFHKEASGFPLCAVREIKFLKSLQHKNIVKLKDVATSRFSERIEIPVKKDVSTVPTTTTTTAITAASHHTTLTTQAANTTMMISEVDIKVDSQKDIDIQEDDDDKNKNKDGKKKDKKSKVNRERERIENSKRNEGGELPGFGNIYLVFEYVDHDLGGLIDAKYNFSPRAIKSIMKQLFEVLDYLSEKKIVHRDIKSSNILLSNRYHVKLADFGLARSLVGPDGFREGKIDLTNNVITMWYKPPELLLGSQRYSHPVDMWSAGCVLAELELGRPLLPGKSEQQQLELICKSIGSPTEENWPGVTSLPNYESLLKNMQKYITTFRTSYTTVISDSVIGLLERILVVDPSRRTSARIALNNNYFSTPPIAPHDPSELEPLNIAGGASLHEFQTKQKRKQKEEALARGEVVDDSINLSAIVKTTITQQTFQQNVTNLIPAQQQQQQQQQIQYSYANNNQQHTNPPLLTTPKVIFIYFSIHSLHF